MNLLSSFTDMFTTEYAGLPLWGWIVIGAFALVVAIVVITLSVSAARKEKNKSAAARPEAGLPAAEEEPAPAEVSPAAEEEPAPAPVFAEEARAEQAPAAEPAPAPAAAVRTESKPAPAAKPAAAAQPAPAQAEAPKAAPSAKVYHITKRVADGKWQIKFNRGKKAIKLFDTQMQAIEYAKALAQNQEASIMIHKEDGTFRKLRYDKPSK